MHTVGSLISTAATYSTRAITAVGVPAYLAMRLLPNSPLKVPGNKIITATLITVSAPATLTCGLGAAEGAVRTIINLFDYCIHCRADTAARKWDQFVKEGTTVHGLIRGALSPISGYTIIADQWKLKEADSRNSTPRTLKTEYYVYRALRAFGRGVIEAAKLAVRFFKWAGEQIVWGFEKLWEGACYVGRTVHQAAAALWNIIQPIRSAVRYLVWDLFLTKIVYKIIVKTVIWEIGVKLLLNYVLWKPAKIAWNWVFWPGLKLIGNFALGILTVAYSLSVWATQLASRLINK